MVRKSVRRTQLKQGRQVKRWQNNLYISESKVMHWGGGEGREPQHLIHASLVFSSAQQLTPRICLESYYWKFSEIFGGASKMLNIIRERMGNKTLFCLCKQ